MLVLKCDRCIETDAKRIDNECAELYDRQLNVCMQQTLSRDNIRLLNQITDKHISTVNKYINDSKHIIPDIVKIDIIHELRRFNNIPSIQLTVTQISDTIDNKVQTIIPVQTLNSIHVVTFIDKLSAIYDIVLVLTPFTKSLLSDNDCDETSYIICLNYIKDNNKTLCMTNANEIIEHHRIHCARLLTLTLMTNADYNEYAKMYLQSLQ